MTGHVCPWGDLSAADEHALSLFYAVAPLAEYGLAALAVDLMPDIRVTREEADGLLGRLLILAAHQQAIAADQAEAARQERD